MTFESAYDAVLTVKARHDRLVEAIAVTAANSEFFGRVRSDRAVPSRGGLNCVAHLSTSASWPTCGRVRLPAEQACTRDGSVVAHTSGRDRLSGARTSCLRAPGGVG